MPTSSGQNRTNRGKRTDPGWSILHSINEESSFTGDQERARSKRILPEQPTLVETAIRRMFSKTPNPEGQCNSLDSGCNKKIRQPEKLSRPPQSPSPVARRLGQAVNMENQDDCEDKQASQISRDFQNKCLADSARSTRPGGDRRTSSFACSRRTISPFSRNWRRTGGY